MKKFKNLLLVLLLLTGCTKPNIPQKKSLVGYYMVINSGANTVDVQYNTIAGSFEEQEYSTWENLFTINKFPYTLDILVTSPYTTPVSVTMSFYQRGKIVNTQTASFIGQKKFTYVVNF